MEVTKEKPRCPICGDTYLEERCARDIICHCKDTITGGAHYCPDCGKPCCPTCGSHDVALWSRVTGYLQSVDGFNSAKKQEVKDRHRTSNQELLA